MRRSSGAKLNISTSNNIMSTETTTTSWSERLGSSFKGVLVGIGLFIAGIPLLFWNEGNFVKTQKTLEEGEAVCVSLPSTETVDSANEGKLVHASGTATTEDELTDDLFNFSKKGFKLVRKVEYYQWDEHKQTSTKKNVGGSETTTTTYSYNKKWVSKPIDSGDFHDPGHDNFNFYPEATKADLYATNAAFGAFRLTESQIQRISGEAAVPTSEITIPAGLAGRAVASGNYIYVGRDVGYGMQPQYPTMVQPVAPVAPVAPAVQPIPADRVMMMPVVANGGFVTVPSIQQTPIAVSTVDGVPFIITPDGNAAAVIANSVMYNGTMHPVAQTIPGNGIVYNPGAVNNIIYANIANYGSLPILKVENKEFVRLPDGTLARIFSENGARQVCVNGVFQSVTIGLTATLPAPVYTPVVQPVMPGPVQPVVMPVQPGMPVQLTVNPSAPQIGDVRISWFLVAPGQTISIIAQQNNDTFAPYVSKETGKSIDLLSMGEKPAAVMFSDAHSANSMMTWLIRFGGWLAMFIGLNMVFKPLSVLGDVIPFIGSMIGFGSKIISFVISTVVALVVISIAWLFYRPLIAIPLLLAAVGLIVWLKMRKKKESAPAEAQ